MARGSAMQGEYSRRLWVTVLALLYGTGLRRGELERLDIEAFDRAQATLAIDGRKSGQRAMRAGAADGAIVASRGISRRGTTSSSASGSSARRHSREPRGAIA